MWSSRPSYRDSSRRSSPSSRIEPEFSLNLARFDKKAGSVFDKIGRNTFPRPEPEASDILGKIIEIYQGRD
jgi:hypothetical protein